MQGLGWQKCIRNWVQFILINFIKATKPIWQSKIFLFSQFMACEDREFLCTQKGSVYYVVMPSDVAVSRRLYIGAGNEHLKTRKALEVLARVKNRPQRSVETLIDVGANLGHISIPLLKDDIIKQAIGFEPDPKNFRICNANILINNVSERFIVHNSALGARDGEFLDFELCEDNLGDHRIRVADSDGVYAESKRKVIKVKSNTLDSYFPKALPVDETLIWIDVQGYEGYVLEGASTLIAQRIPIGFEFWPYGLERAKSFERLFNAIKGYGYYYDLSDPQPSAKMISELKGLYQKYIKTLSGTDILVF